MSVTAVQTRGLLRPFLREKQSNSLERRESLQGQAGFAGPWGGDCVNKAAVLVGAGQVLGGGLGALHLAREAAGGRRGEGLNPGAWGSHGLD